VIRGGGPVWYLNIKKGKTIFHCLWNEYSPRVQRPPNTLIGNCTNTPSHGPAQFGMKWTGSVSQSCNCVSSWRSDRPKQTSFSHAVASNVLSS
jgi:hypothetical protein